MTDDHKMPGFIQAMYGTIAGVSFFTIVENPFNGNDKKNLFFDFSLPIDWNVVFSLTLFTFSIIVIAHDWFSYHKYFSVRKNSFLYYTPQIGSLIFLAQMLSVCKFGNLKMWFVFAEGYVVFNIINFVMNYSKENKQRYTLLYLTYFFIPIVGYILSSSTATSTNRIVLFALIVLITALWLWRDSDKDRNAILTVKLEDNENDETAIYSLTLTTFKPKDESYKKFKALSTYFRKRSTIMNQEFEGLQKAVEANPEKTILNTLKDLFISGNE